MFTPKPLRPQSWYDQQVAEERTKRVIERAEKLFFNMVSMDSSKSWEELTLESMRISEMFEAQCDLKRWEKS